VYVSPSGQPAVQQPTNAGRHHLGRGGGLGTTALGMNGTFLRGQDETHFLAIAGGAGLLGGVVLAEAFEGHERHERREEAEAYNEGRSSFFYFQFLYTRTDPVACCARLL
jgi:hypothetical protein